MFEYLEHDADIGIFLKSNSLNGLFSDALIALIQYSFEQLSIERKYLDISIEYKELQYLLHDFLSEIVYQINVGNYIISLEDMKMDLNKCIFRLGYIENVKFKNDVKAITNHRLEFNKESNFYIAKVFFDI